MHVDFILTSVRGPAFEVYLHEGGKVYQSFTTDRPARTYLGTVQEFPGAVAAGRRHGLRLGRARTAHIDEVVQPADLVGTVVYLVSDASKLMTGQTLNLDGGTVFS